MLWKVQYSGRKTEKEQKCRMWQLEYHWQNVLKLESNLWSHPERGAHGGVPAETGAGQLSRHTWKNEGKLSSEQLLFPSRLFFWMVPSWSGFVMLWPPLQVNFNVIFPVLCYRPNPQGYWALQLRLCTSFDSSNFSRTEILVPNESFISNLTPYILTG